ncbi:hypothetical protein DU48_05135 [Methanosarcina mazei]|uniref:Uncharacterized protein n=1 Tax=Methanosarcina mazei TaxID=2209 RepID=A0A0F8NZ89_METMZ|nr:hypothetical protein DU46_00615 [Methanosarcina mazei]KKG78419.1 hypothetical protein DU61_00065 [Methanosarcina mazei]KKG84961.1 hypothetical protein DU59_03555 [Methanosarcina mazei]KKG86496.1 hypothetical protein DU57_05565 [Methanosarcina mazei]KKH06368.1 hypothetical protein DU62_17510 [Methanosarcina mazei]
MGNKNWFWDKLYLKEFQYSAYLKKKIHKLSVEVLEERKEVEKTNKSTTNEKNLELIILWIISKSNL